ncbi:MAG: hypothetical protein J0I65_27125 [Variovorax sp.]|nr:hypothetical protein [Variovorax sp.]|tara:strand:- start:243 stop:767 length:525 start_codon:yes stop_codon:yes gene_type:complete
MRYLLLLSITLALSPAAAQKMYRCGNTFSQTPCDSTGQATDLPKGANQSRDSFEARLEDLKREQAKGEKNIHKLSEKLPPVPAPSAEAVAANEDLCRKSILLQLKDPDSAKFERGFRGNAQNYYGPKSEVVSGIAYYQSVNAKNSFGGYTGAQTWVCYFDMNEKAVEWVSSPRS